MNISDFNKDLQRLLLVHWTQEEINDHLKDPEYFFHQLVTPRLDYLRAQGEDQPQVRLHRLASGELKFFLRP